MELNFIFLILIPLVTAFLIPVVDIIYKKIRKVLVVSSIITELVLSILLFSGNYQRMLAGNLSIIYNMSGWASNLGIALRLDSLGLFFSTLVSVILFLIILYSIGFIGHHEGKYYVLMFLLLAAMQGAVLTGDVFNLYVFIELITITSAALVTFRRNREASEAAFKYLLYGVLGGLFFLTAVFLIYYNLGTLNMNIIGNKFTQMHRLMQGTIIVFFLTSIFIKLGVFPLHFWRPKAYSTSPGPISALLSGILVKVYIYIFIRIFWQITDSVFLNIINLKYFIFYLSLISSTIGHFLAFREDDIKRLLAFSSIGHISLIIAALVLNTAPGFYGGLLHVISHLLMKTTLFIVVGYLLQYTGSRHIADFAGVAYNNQWIFVSFIISAMAMVGIPPLPGFFSKFFIITAFIEAGHYFAGLLTVFLSVVSLIYYLRFIFRGYNLLDYERGLKPKKVGLVLSVFYRERIVTGISYVFTL
ncbi:MAG: complex I subunit 5 family protein, partial [Halothermotrichaceae bacterium]